MPLFFDKWSSCSASRFQWLGLGTEILLRRNGSFLCASTYNLLVLPDVVLPDADAASRPERLVGRGCRHTHSPRSETELDPELRRPDRQPPLSPSPLFNTALSCADARRLNSPACAAFRAGSVDCRVGPRLRVLHVLVRRRSWQDDGPSLSTAWLTRRACPAPSDGAT